MIRLFQRSLVISKDQIINKFGVTYNIREFCKENNEENINSNNNRNLRKEFEKFKKRKQIEKIFTGEDENNKDNIYKIKREGEESTIDVDFISKKLGVQDKSKYIDLRDLVTGAVKEQPGYENFDLTPEESAYGLAELEKLLKSEGGENVVSQLINELKQAFGLESDGQMDKKLEDLNKEMTLRLGEPVEAFIANNQDLSKLNQHQRLVVHEYFEKHPFLKNIRQTSFVLDLISLSEQYEKSDGVNFEENVKKYFNIDPNTISTTTKAPNGSVITDVDPFATQDLEDVDFVQPVDTPYIMANQDGKNGADNNSAVLEDKMVEIIRSGVLSVYLQKVITDAREAIDPVSVRLEREAREKKIENEMQIQDRILEREMEMVDLNSREGSTQATLNGEQDNELVADDYYDADVIPEIDMVGPEEGQQQAKDPRDLLKYYHLYPRQVKKWIDYSHTPMGLFTSFGVWYNLPTWYTKHFQPTPPESHISSKKNQNVFKQPELPDDLKNAYRFGVTEEEARLLHPKFKEFLSFRNASQPEVNAYRKQVCIEKFGDSLQDTGSPTVQIAILTERINSLSAHLAKNKKDFVAKKRIPELERKRRNLIAYLKRTNIEQYFMVTKDLKLKNFNF